MIYFKQYAFRALDCLQPSSEFMVKSNYHSFSYLYYTTSLQSYITLACNTTVPSSFQFQPAASK